MKQGYISIDEVIEKIRKAHSKFCDTHAVREFYDEFENELRQILNDHFITIEVEELTKRILYSIGISDKGVSNLIEQAITGFISPTPERKTEENQNEDR